jgi:hypothetical protein
MMSDSHRKFSGLLKDKDGNLTIAQWPNIPIVGWLVFKVFSMLAHDPRLEAGFSAISTAFLFTWAYLEIQSGVNYFRKLLGLIVISALLYGFFR